MLETMDAGTSSSADPSHLLEIETPSDIQERPNSNNDAAVVPRTTGGLPKASGILSDLPQHYDVNIVDVDLDRVDRGVCGLSGRLRFQSDRPNELEDLVSEKEWNELRSQVDANAQSVTWNLGRPARALFLLGILIIVADFWKDMEAGELWRNIVFVAVTMAILGKLGWDGYKDRITADAARRELTKICREHSLLFRPRGFTVELMTAPTDEIYRLFLNFRRLR
jgi:hypothetical protein